jgi:hypothetical protein
MVAAGSVGPVVGSVVPRGILQADRISAITSTVETIIKTFFIFSSPHSKNNINQYTAACLKKQTTA